MFSLKKFNLKCGKCDSNLTTIKIIDKKADKIHYQVIEVQCKECGDKEEV